MKIKLKAKKLEMEELIMRHGGTKIYGLDSSLRNDDDDDISKEEDIPGNAVSIFLKNILLAIAVRR